MPGVVRPCPLGNAARDVAMSAAIRTPSVAVHAIGAAPDHAYYAQVKDRKDRKDGKRAALSEDRKIIRPACID